MKLLLGIVFSIIAMVSPASADTLRLLNWEDYLSEDAQQLWQQRGHTIDTVLFDNDEKRDAILVNAQKNKIDVAVVDENIGKLFGSKGKLLEMNESNVPALANIDPFWRKRCGKFAVPYLWGTMGIAYRSDVIRQPPDSWSALLEPTEQLKGHISMMDDFTDMLAPALFMRGYSLNTANRSQLKQVFEMLKQQAPAVLTYDYPITFVDNSEHADQLYMAQVYGGDHLTLNDKAGVEGLWKYVVPKEGSVLWVDSMAISSSTNNKTLAYQFVNFISEAKVAAINAEKLYLATPNTKSFVFLSQEFKNDREVFPDEATLKRSQLYQVLTSETIQLRMRITNAVVNIYESSKAR
jgi:spermidine/putrescine transport system substrate-binding protein